MNEQISNLTQPMQIEQVAVIADVISQLAHTYPVIDRYVYHAGFNMPKLENIDQNKAAINAFNFLIAEKLVRCKSMGKLGNQPFMESACLTAFGYWCMSQKIFTKQETLGDMLYEYANTTAKKKELAEIFDQLVLLCAQGVPARAGMQ